MKMATKQAIFGEKVEEYWKGSKGEKGEILNVVVESVNYKMYFFIKN
jgi:hypothetical protein